MEKTIELSQRLYRRATVEHAERVKKDDEEERLVLDLSFSSEEPVDRFLDGDFGREVLDHDPSSVRLGRLEDGGPVLIDHENKVLSLVGAVQRVGIEDRVGRARVEFDPDDEVARKVFNKAKRGILRNVSVGYQIHRFVKERDADTNQITFRVTDWEPMEISMVAVPADPTVGPGRKVDPYSVRVIEDSLVTEPDDAPPEEPEPLDAERAEPEPTDVVTSTGRTDMSEDVTIDVNQVREETVAAERARVSGIQEIVDLYPQLSDEGARALTDGTTVDEFRRLALKRIHNADPMPAPPKIGLDEKDVRQFSVLRLLRALAFGQQDRGFLNDAGFELEVCNVARNIQQKLGVERIQGTIIPIEVLHPRMAPASDGNMARAIVEKFPELRSIVAHQRLLTAGTATDGAELVAEDLLAGSFIDVLRNASFVVQAGATVLTDLNGNVAIPRKTSGSVAGWLATEGVTQASQSEAQFDQVTMTPRNLAVYGQYSRQLLLQSSLDIENLMRMDMAAGMGTEMDRASLYGSGAAGQPTGLANQTGVNAPASFAAANPTWAEVVAMETANAVDNALFTGSTSYMLKPDMRGALKTSTKVSADAGAGFVWDVNSPASPLNGYPAWVTNQVVAGDLFFGYWPDLLIGMWGGLDVIVDPYTDARRGNVGITNHQSADIAVRHPTAFAFNNDGV